MRLKRTAVMVLVFLMIVSIPVKVLAATDSIRAFLAADSNYKAMDACATDGTYIYVLKHKGDSYNWTLHSYTKTGVLVDKKEYTAKYMTHPNGLTYYNGYLYIAPIGNYVIRVKVTGAGKISATASSCSINHGDSDMATVGAITYVSGKDFIIRGYGNTYAVYTINESDSTASFVLKSQLSMPNGIGESFNTINDIFYYANKLYVVTWRKEADGGGRANRIAVYNYNSSSYSLSYADVLRITGGTVEVNKFELESGCVIGGYLYYATNDENGDSIYKYDKKL